MYIELWSPNNIVHCSIVQCVRIQESQKRQQMNYGNMVMKIIFCLYVSWTFWIVLSIEKLLVWALFNIWDRIHDKKTVAEKQISKAQSIEFEIYTVYSSQKLFY